MQTDPMPPSTPALGSRPPPVVAVPVRDAVVVALQLDAVPVHARRMLQLVEDRNLDRLTTGEQERRPWRGHARVPQRIAQPRRLEALCF